MGTRHARSLKALGNAEIVLFADVIEERAAKLQAEIGSGTVVSNVHQAWEDPRVDAVIIATHHDSHPDFAVRAANGGKHIFIEKPLSLTLEGAHQVVEPVQKNKVNLMVGFQARFATLVQQAKAHIPNALVSTGQIVDPRWGDTSWAQSPERGGANVLSQGVHTFDLLCHFHEARPVAIAAGGGTFTHPGSPLIDSVVSTILFADGSTAAAVIGDFGPAHHVKKSFYQVFDGRGKSATLFDYYAGLTVGEGRDVVKTTTVEQLTGEEKEDYLGYRQEMREFVHSIIERRPLQRGATEVDGLFATALALGAFQSIRHHKFVDLPKIS